MSKGLIPDDFVADLRDQAPLADLVGEYTELRVRGDTAVGLCPLHTERTPSFHVRWNRYHCFGCGASGDIFDFLKAVNGADFKAAVQLVADRAGIPMPEGRADPAAAMSRTTRTVLSAAAELLAHWLRDPVGLEARRFLSSRHFDATAAEAWGLGYNPGGNSLTAALLKRGFRADQLIAAGVTKSAQGGRTYDVFRNRLIWPLKDPTGRICGLAGRSLEVDPKQMKYINSEESPIYQKSRLLFGLWEARKSILTTREVLVVEGYTDVMACAAVDHGNVVSTSGTTFSAHQAELLHGRLDDEGTIVAGFDNDDAGRKAAWSLFLACQTFTAQIMAIDFSDYGGKADACHVRTTAGDAALAAVIASRIPVLKMLIDHDLAAVGDDGDPETKVAAARKVLTRLKAVQSPILRYEYQQYAARILGTDPAHLGAAGEPRTVAPPPRRFVERPTNSADDVAVAAAVIANPTLTQAVLDECRSVELSEIVGAELADIVQLSAAGFPGGRPTASEESQLWCDYMETVTEHTEHALMWKVAFAEPLNGIALLAAAVRTRQHRLRADLGDLRRSGSPVDQIAVVAKQLRLLRTADCLRQY